MSGFIKLTNTNGTTMHVNISEIIWFYRIPIKDVTYISVKNEDDINVLETPTEIEKLISKSKK